MLTMITTVKTRKTVKIRKKDPDRGLDQIRKREKSLVRKNVIKGIYLFILSLKI